jgi:AcrR family transcriptional regulator
MIPGRVPVYSAPMSPAKKRASTAAAPSKKTATKTPVAGARVRQRAPREGAFDREHWLAAARKMLIKSGIDQVKIERLSKQVKVTRSSFYWHFRSRADLLDALLDHWQATNTGPMLRAIEAAIAAGPTGIHILGRVWIEEREFSPAYDTAVRDWARKDAKVAATVRDVDDKRIAALIRLMQVYGYKGNEALVRARIMYFHQVGYYALGIHESAPDRLKLEPIYMKALTGWDV